MLTALLQKFAILLVYHFAVEGKDLLHLFRPKPDLPHELNDFLTDVQHHKKDFAFIRNVAKNRKKYQKSYQENHHLFAEDLENQLTLAPYYSKRLNNFDNQNSQINNIRSYNMYDQFDKSQEFDGQNNFRSYYPKERFSKYIHSPVRLRRKLEQNYLDTHVEVNPNSMYGEIQRPEPKFPGHRFVDDQNRYHTGYVVGMDDDDEYPEIRNPEKKKREVEINIKSDGKLVKKIEEDDNGPKSIVLNIKASNSNDKSQQAGNSEPQISGLAQSSTVSVEPTQINNNLEKGPSNSKTIPSLNGNPNQNNAQTKNIGIPINSIPASNKNGQFNLNDNSKNALNENREKESPTQDASKSLKLQNYNFPEVAKVSNNEDLKQKLESYNSKSFGGYNRQPENNFENSRWSGDSNHMAKSIDIAQNNVNSFGVVQDKSALEVNQGEPKKESEFDQVQGLLMDSTSVNDRNKENTNKRRSLEEKMDDDMQINVDEANLPLEIENNENSKVPDIGIYDYDGSLGQQAPDLGNPDSDGILVKHNEHFQIIEHSTTEIYFIPIGNLLQQTTNEVIKIEVGGTEENGNVIKVESSGKGNEEEAEIIGNIIAKEMKKENEAETTNEPEESTECIHVKNAQGGEEEIEIVKHKEPKGGELKSHGDHGSHKGSNEEVKEIEIVHKEPPSPKGHHHCRDQKDHKTHEEKRAIVKKKKPKYIFKKQGENDKKPLPKSDENAGQNLPASKQEWENREYLDKDGYRNKKHLPASMSKYKKKKTRQHPKKRVFREEHQEPSLMGYYDFNNMYGAPDDTFDFIPSYNKRQLKSVEYEYDPNLIHDVGNHEEEEIEKFKRAENAANKKTENKIKSLKENESENIQEVLSRKNTALASNLAHGGHSLTKKKKNKAFKRENKGNEMEKTEQRNIHEDVSSFHGRGNFNSLKHKKINSRRENFDPVNQNTKDLDKPKVPYTGNDKFFAQLDEKPLSNQQKQDIFLRYNPDFQRWPRFVQSDQKYREIMKQRSLENQKRYFRNARNLKRFPISNEYFLNPQRPEFVNREEPATVATTATATTGGEATTAGESKATEAAAGATTDSATSKESFAEEKEQATETTPNMESQAGNQEGDATLPQAAKNILQTANSDIFENTTVPGLEGLEGGNIAGNGTGANGEGSTLFQFTTNADDLSHNTECAVSHKETLTPCPDENASHSPVTLTSVLPLVPEAATELRVNMTKAEYLDLNDIVGGSLPRDIVSKSLSGAKGTFRQGLNTGKFNMNLKLLNVNSSAETKLILNEMTNLMLKLKYHTTCQILPVNLRSYLKIITKNVMDSPMAKLKEMEEIDFDEHQSSYVFHTSEGDSIQGKAQVLKDLLNKYNNLPTDCKERAEPVKEYIESHLAMIDNMEKPGKDNSKLPTATSLGTEAGSAPPTAAQASTAAPAAEATAGSSTETHPKAKKEISLSDSNNRQENELDNQMMEEGLNNQKPNANEVIEEDKKSKREALEVRFPPLFGRELSTSTSPQYGKLANAVRKLRHRRENHKRISEIYGKAKREEVDKVENQDESRKEEKGFESPLVINF